MATAATQEKLNALIGVSDMDLSEVKLVLKYWDECPKRLHGGVIRSIKNLDKIPASVQLDLINASERATRAIGELLSVEAQDLIIDTEDFEDDLLLIVRKASTFAEISDKLWLELVKAVKNEELTRATIRRLVARRDCPVKFAKAAGYTQETFEKAQIKAGVAKAVRPVKKAAVKKAAATKTRPAKATSSNKAKTVKTRRTAKPEDDEDFADPKKVASHVRVVRRPR